MWSLIRTICGTARSSFRTKRELALENLALRHQIGVLTRALGDRHPRFGSWDRALWIILARRWEAQARCHLSLVGDAPEPRLAHGPELGRVVELPEVGGLHHRYERAAA